MVSPSSPPSSPTKRILRNLVTGVQPIDAETHAKRWNKGVEKGGPTQEKNGARVAGLVKEWETSFSSKPYSAMPPGPSSPAKTKPTPQVRTNRPPILGSTQSPLPSPASSSSESRSPTTVPASFFQLQQARRTPPASPTGAKFLPFPSQNGKENEPRPTFQPSPRSQTSSLHKSQPPSGTTPLETSRGTISGNSVVSDAATALTGLTLETMATRSSGSTHASSSRSDSADEASVRMASKVDVRDQTTPRKVSVQQIPAVVRPSPPPQIVQTAPTPRRQVAPSSIPFVVNNTPSSRPQYAPSPSPPLPPRSPCGSSFVEALPASYPSRSPNGSPLPSPVMQSNEYQPLPLDNPLPLPPSERTDRQVSNPSRPKPRARASTVGAGLKPSFVSTRVTVETAEEKSKRVEAEFERLLDTMELPDRSVRNKMLGLAFPLKEEMLRSSSNPSSTSSPPGTSRPTHQRGRSSNLSSPYSASTGASVPAKKESQASTTGGGGGVFKSTFLRKTKSNQSLRHSTNSRSLSTDASADSSNSTSTTTKPSHGRTPSATSILFRSFGKSSGTSASMDVRKDTANVEGEDAAWWAERLQILTCAQLDVKEMGRLRGRLRNEAPVWVDEFIKAGGYVGMLQRLKELLEMEWREEQHDDQVLHELLRAFKALTLTACGKRALSSHHPTPFLPIAALLFSEKRPGDLPCRQILVELLTSLFEICPLEAEALPKSAWSSTEVSLETPLPSPPTSSFVFPSSAQSGSTVAPGSGIRRYQRKIKSSDSDSDSIEREEVLTPERFQATHRFVVSLMEGPPDEKEEAKVDFIKQAHRPRMFKKWVTEISDCVRDYFWIFCHSQNLYWTFEQLDVAAIEAPKVPSGMTGGVEFEAMSYAAAHFRLLNAIARTCPTVEAAFAFHDQLFQSGFERVLFTLRRASLVYYQSLHLEMSRYISLARSARFNLGPRILSCIDRRFLRPEEIMVVQMMEQQQLREQREQQTRNGGSGAPQIGAIF